MILNNKVLEKLRILINEDTQYRSGPELVKFFNRYGFNDIYQNGFPSRWKYTDEKLNQINGTPKLDSCIKDLFAPVNFIGRIPELDKHIKEFNQYLAFDKWAVVRDSENILFKKLDKIHFDEAQKSNIQENDFLNREFSNISINNLKLDIRIAEILQLRISEIEKCYSSESYLAVILLAGSVLEAVFLGLAINNPKIFNIAKASPKNKENKVKEFHDWKLAEFINVSKEIGLIEQDTQKFSHTLRDFRNYIHPFEQMASSFMPREQTAKLCLQVLKSAIFDIQQNLGKIN